MPAAKWNEAGVDAWEQWTAYLAARSRPRSLHQLLPEGKRPLTWGLECTPLGEQRAEVEGAFEDLRRLTHGKQPRAAAELQATIEAWLTRGEHGQPAGTQATADALLAVALANALPALPSLLGYDRWKQLFHALTSLAEGPHEGRPWSEAPLDWLWRAAELPLTLAWQFPELDECQPLAALAREAYSQILEEMLDSEGCPGAGHIALIRPLLASCTRAAAIAAQTDEPCWNEAGESQFSWLVRQGLRWTLRDGSPVTLPAMTVEPGRCDELLAAALRLGGDRDDRRAARVLFPQFGLQKKGHKKKDKVPAFNKAPDPAAHTEWGACTLLRTSWRRDAWLLAVRHDAASTELALHVGPELLLAGAWGFDVQFEGEKLAMQGPWEVVCWTSDEEGCYLELAAELAQDVALNRQFYLPRDEEFFFAADTLYARQPGRLEYRTRLPLGPRAALTPADKTREVLITSGAVQGRIFPLALGEWRSDRRVGDLQLVDDERHTGNGHAGNGHAGNGHAAANGACATACSAAPLTLELTQRTVGQGLYAPWFIDLRTKRLSKPFTWRNLVVGQQRSIVAPDTAVGYRVQCGKEQWLVYRSLGPTANRTVLGKNLLGDFLLARFKPQGATQTLIEIEP